MVISLFKSEALSYLKRILMQTVSTDAKLRAYQVESLSMRIAIITGEFPKVSETFVMHHINGLLKLGHEVDVYAEYRSRGADFARDDLLAADLQGRTSYIDMPSLRTGKRLLSAPYRIAYCGTHVPRLTLDALNPMRFGRKAVDFSQVNRLYGLARIDRNRQYDVIHAHFGMVGDHFRFAGALWEAPIVVSFHGFDVSMWPREHGSDCYTRLFKVASALAVNSDNTRKRVIDLGCPPHKIEKLYPSWDMASFSYTDHQRDEGTPMRVLTVARLVEKKGVEDAVAAIALVKKSHPNVRYDVVGDGPLRPRIETLIDTLDLREAVTLHGAQSRDYVRRMMEDAHVFLLPSVTSRTGDEEGLGVVLLEAQSTGLPVVATMHGPFPEVVIHGETGFLAPEHASEQLAHWLVFLIEHPQTASQMGRAAREHVERNFAPDQIDAHCVDLYERVIDEFRAHR